MTEQRLGYNPFDPARHDPPGQEPEVKPAGWKRRQASRRKLVQVFHRLDKCVTELIEERKTARAVRALDEVQNLTEAIYHAKVAITHLRHIARHEFDKSLEELEGYK